jgi:hypothetical protein
MPPDATKMTPELDALPPQLHSIGYEEPVPLSSIINTAGGADWAFMMPDGNTLYFWFTPDVSIPSEKQPLDDVTGIYVAQKRNGQWNEPERAYLQDVDELSLDGCLFIEGNTMWFCSARKGDYRGVDVRSAQSRDGLFTNWENAGKKLNVDYEVGELHITADGRELYFHSARVGGKGNYDIWVTSKVNGQWQEPENIEAVNTAANEGWPFITLDGDELWFTRTSLGSPSVFRSRRIDGE